MPACWHYGYNSQYAVPTTQRGLSPYKMLFRGALAPTAPMVPPPMVDTTPTLPGMSLITVWIMVLYLRWRFTYSNYVFMARGGKDEIQTS